ncbi:MAG TPA: non-ribosomal peptide synthetase [Acidimicrobiia bacterium]
MRTSEIRAIADNKLPPDLQWTDADLDGTVTDRLLKVAAATPDSPAVVGLDGTRLAFADLRAAAISLAEEIIERIGPGPGRVATYVDPNPGAIVAIFGILAAGKTYVPIEPGEPAGRSRAKLEHSGSELLVAPQVLSSPALELIDRSRIVQRETRVATNSLTPPALLEPDGLFNLVYTSGSTGMPKGVLQSHRNVLFETCTGARDMGTRPTERFGLVMPLTFGASVSDFLGSLLNGAALHMFDLRRRGSAALAEWMDDERINASHMVPTVFRRWMAELEPGQRYPEMRAIKLGGEPVFHTDVAAFQRHFGPECVLRNGLGTTETYLITALMIGPEDTVADGIVPVGYAVDGKSVKILDDAGEPVPDGDIGNITVIGEYLSPGYWQDEETTDRKYGVDAASGTRTYQPGDVGRIRPDGMLEHLGRSDDMVKINGSRVEVGEVEAALLEQPAIDEAAVVAQPAPDGSLRLVGYIVGSGETVNHATLRANLADQMPPHMVPSVFVEMDALPVLSFGKIDRRALPLPDGRRPELGIPYRAPSNDAERVIAAHAAAILRIEQVGVDDDLFSLGMDSLLATRLVALTGQSLGLNLTVDVILDNPSVSGLAVQTAAAEPNDVETDLAAMVAELEASEQSVPQS